VELSKASHRTEEVLVAHASAVLTPAGRLRLARCVVEQRWPLRRAADRFGVSHSTAGKWAARYRRHGPAGLADRSSRPRSCPHQLPRRTERRIVGLRVSRRWGPARIAYRLRLNPATVARVLARYGCPPLRFIDPATGVRIKTSRRPVLRYEHPAPGDLVHVDTKKLGRIPDGGGHRTLGPAAGKRNRPAGGAGYAVLHSAVDDHSRLAYSEILTDERTQTAAAFWLRARAWFADYGITVRRVLTDNGSPYRSHLFREALGPDVTPKRCRPYRPQTNGKVERFHRTLLEEWAYARPYASEAERVAAYPAFLHTYNHHRGHTALDGQAPADRVSNLARQNT
jgi:transposase InsO family protein